MTSIIVQHRISIPNIPMSNIPLYFTLAPVPRSSSVAIAESQVYRLPEAGIIQFQHRQQFKCCIPTSGRVNNRVRNRGSCWARFGSARGRVRENETSSGRFRSPGEPLGREGPGRPEPGFDETEERGMFSRSTSCCCCVPVLEKNVCHRLWGRRTRPAD